MRFAAYAQGRNWQILLQKSATVTARRLPGFWGTSCYFAPLGSEALGKLTNRLDYGYALVTQDMHRPLAAVGRLV